VNLYGEILDSRVGQPSDSHANRSSTIVVARRPHLKGNKNQASGML